MIKKRSIRLKEFSPSLVKLYKPSIDYLNASPKLDNNRSYFVSVDQNGYMKSNNNFLSKNKLYLFGASTIENLYVDCQKRIHSLLEAEFIKNDFDVEVLNAGYSGSNLLGLFNVLINKIGNNPEDLDRSIILFLPSNDSSCMLYKESYWNGSKKHANIIPQSGLYSYNPDKIKNMNDFENILKLFISFCKLYDIKIYVSGVIFYENDSLNFKTFLLQNEVAKKLCACEGVPYLNISEVIRKDSDCFYDNVHLLKYGSERVSQEIFNFLKNDFKKNRVNKFRECLNEFEVVMNSETFWSEKIKCEEGEILNSFFDFNVYSKVNDKSLLWVFDFFCEKENIESQRIPNMIFNSVIGWCRYVKDVPEEGGVVLPLHLEIPKGVTQIKIGVRKFNPNAEFYIKSLSVNVFSNHL